MKCSLQNLRHIPSLDLYDAVWGGWLRRVDAKDESALATYLGPEGHAIYTVRATVSQLQQDYGVQPWETDGTKEMLFSPHWAGICCTWPGTDCGDQPQEAFHSPWQQQLTLMGDLPPATAVFNTMQTLYTDKWATQCEWDSTTPLLNYPTRTDDHWLSGPLLPRLGRTTAINFWDAKDTHSVHLVHDVSATLQVVAVSRVASAPLDVKRASQACKLAVAHGDDLMAGLREAGILKDSMSYAPLCFPFSLSLSLFLYLYLSLSNSLSPSLYFSALPPSLNLSILQSLFLSRCILFVQYLSISLSFSLSPSLSVSLSLSLSVSLFFYTTRLLSLCFFLSVSTNTQTLRHSTRQG